MKEILNTVSEEASKKLNEIKSSVDLEEFKQWFIGRKGKFTELSKSIGKIQSDERKLFGQQINKLKNEILEKVDDLQKQFSNKDIESNLEKEWFDVTLDPYCERIGSLHPISIVQYELEDIFTAMGFKIMDGPHIENDYYNFEALNIPAHHPARDSQDTFFLENGFLLRTQTSDIQIRTIEKVRPPLRIVGPGKVFRAERLDATHECCFHQIEGMVVDKNISVGNLIYFLKNMVSMVLGKETEIRLRPGYFPFVEPGFELEVACFFCDQKGCKVCKQVGWIELLGCGMVHPNVLKAGDIDPEEFSGFAFGMGIDRLAMNKYGINNIRYFHNPDLRFHRKFSVRPEV